MAKAKNVIEIEGKTLELSNLDKVMFRLSGFTKAQVIDYYIRISTVLLPHLKDRPLTMKRFPDGVDGQHFYEKDAPRYTPEWVETVDVPRKNNPGKIKFIMVNNLPTLVWCANLANLEMHCFLAKAPHIQKPTTVVFDLDPGEPADTLTCAQVALWLREVLEKLKLNCVVKVSGSKGIQMYVPLNTDSDYELASAFSHAIALRLQELQPETVISNMSKNLRKGKVFIDWSQNSDFKTTVCVYSLRAKREEPYISSPVEFKELEIALKKQDMESLFFLPDAALKRVEEMGDLFAPVLKQKQKIPKDFEAKLQKINSLSEPIQGTSKKSKSQISGFSASQKSGASESRGSSKSKTSAKKSETGKQDGSLKAYNAKRDFTQTKEPPGKKKEKGAAQDLMFVIQKHEARQLHYDFRLEMEGVLRSWAVPKGIPTTKGDKRLAMHVEDHPMDYARFEGIIPQGNYGAGTVMVWDIGTYTVEDGHPVRDYYSGKLPLIMNGKKLQGRWTLVRTKKDQYGKESWLLLKSEQSMPAFSAKRDDQSAISGRSMKQIEAAKDAEWISNRKSS